MTQITLNVPDISCAHCEKTILTVLQDQPGVESVQVSLPNKNVYLTYNDQALTLDQIKDLLDEEGYPVASVSEGASPEPPRRGFIPLTSR
ncbi:MAG TPA: heavy-metal-associated domain-containing protein [Chloroflexia bacterium]|jgi:copper chaperone